MSHYNTNVLNAFTNCVGRSVYVPHFGDQTNQDDNGNSQTDFACEPTQRRKCSQGFRAAHDHANSEMVVQC